MRHKEPFRVRFSEADRRGFLTPVSLYNYFQETAIAHGECAGISPDGLNERGYAWILNRIVIEVSAYPKQGDRLMVETWGSSLRGLYAIREWRARDEKGRDLAAGTSRWVLLDVNKKRVVRLPDFLRESYGEYDERAVEDSFGRFDPAEESDFVRDFQVRASDLDTNDHANSACYVDWCVESLPHEVHDFQRLSRLELIYKTECVLGDRLSAASVNDGEARYQHVLRRHEDDAVLAYGRSEWSAISDET